MATVTFLRSGLSLSIRRAGPADAAAVRSLVRAAHARWVPLIGREPRPMGADHDAAVRDHQLDILLESGRLVGVIEMIPRQDHLWIENVAVSPLHQGRGYGHRLLAHAEVMARAVGLPALRLLTNGALHTNIAFYQRLGFRITHEEPYLDGTTVHMEKRLE